MNIERVKHAECVGFSENTLRLFRVVAKNVLFLLRIPAANISFDWNNRHTLNYALSSDRFDMCSDKEESFTRE